jgi:DNA-binding NarL/FixJ family response regulator
MNSGSSIGVLVVDPQPVVRVGLDVALRADPGIRVAALCDNGQQAISACADPEVSVVLMDIVLADMSGIEVCRSIKRLRPDVDVLVLTACDDNQTVFDAIAAGASGYILKDISIENLHRAIRAVRRGDTMLHPGIARRVLARLSVVAKNGGESHNGSGLTERESSILGLVAKGATNKEIAIKLFMSESTVKSRLRIIFNKIDVHDRTQAAAYAVRGGYVM